MKANELRIGNWVKCNTGIGTVVSISETGFSVSRKGDSLVTDEDVFEPIPLTADIVLKSGFAKGVREDCFLDQHPNLMQLTITGDEFAVQYKADEPMEGAIFNSDPIAYVKYVHHFQNLYFALTGVELPVDL